MTDQEFNKALAEQSERMQLTLTLPLSADDEGGSATIYVEQGSKGKDISNLVISEGNTVFSLCFLKAKDLDKLADFLSDAATQLRYCVKEAP